MCSDSHLIGVLGLTTISRCLLSSIRRERANTQARPIQSFDSQTGERRIEHYWQNAPTEAAKVRDLIADIAAR